MSEEELETGDFARGIVWDSRFEIDPYPGDEGFDEEFASRPSCFQDLYLLFWHDAEVCNGGHLQYMLNSAGTMAPEAADVMDRFGFPDLGENIRKCCALFGPEFPRDRVIRADLLDVDFDNPGKVFKMHGDKTEPFDDHYDSRQDELWTKIDDFVRKNLE